MSRLKWNQFGQIYDTEKLLDYLEGREYKHAYFFHYTKLGALDGILKKKCFWINSFDSFNDKAEARRLDHPEHYFALCFSTGINENLPLWYLYSGLAGDGGRIWIKKTDIKKLIEGASYELYEKDSKNQPTGVPVPLTVNEDITTQFGDVIYFGENNGKNLDLKYNTMTNHIIPSSEKQIFLEKMSGFVKSLVWYYEKETRLLIKLNKQIIARLEPGKKYMIVMHFSEQAFKSMHLTFGPEVNDILVRAQDYKTIRDFILSTSHVEYSAFKGEINMGLCQRCEFKNNSTKTT